MNTMNPEIENAVNHLMNLCKEKKVHVLVVTADGENAISAMSGDIAHIGKIIADTGGKDIKYAAMICASAQTILEEAGAAPLLTRKPNAQA